MLVYLFFYTLPSCDCMQCSYLYSIDSGVGIDSFVTSYNSLMGFFVIFCLMSVVNNYFYLKIGFHLYIATKINHIFLTHSRN